MAKFNPLALSIEQQDAPVSRDFKQRNGEMFTLWLQAMSEPLKGVAQDLRDKLITRYLGDPDNDIPPEMDFPPIEGGKIVLSKALLQNASVLEIMQPESAPERYSAIDFVYMAHTLRPAEWQRVLRFSNEVTAAAQKGD